MSELPEEIWVGYESCPIIPGNGHLKAYKKETNYAKQKYIRSPQWQPIETAPKDGTTILGGWNDAFEDNNSGTPICWQKCALRPDGGWFMIIPFRFLDDGKIQCGNWVDLKDYPSHWRPPLPQPPEEI